jgi:hypothetical protein
MERQHNGPAAYLVWPGYCHYGRGLILLVTALNAGSPAIIWSGFALFIGVGPALCLTGLVLRTAATRARMSRRRAMPPVYRIGNEQAAQGGRECTRRGRVLNACRRQRGSHFIPCIPGRRGPQGAVAREFRRDTACCRSRPGEEIVFPGVAGRGIVHNGDTRSRRGRDHNIRHGSRRFRKRTCSETTYGFCPSMIAAGSA